MQKLQVTPWTAALQAPLSMGFSSKNTGVGGCAALQGASHPRIKPGSPALQADPLLSEPPGKPSNFNTVALI